MMALGRGGRAFIGICSGGGGAAVKEKFGGGGAVGCGGGGVDGDDAVGSETFEAG